ncbi:MAG: thioredoxin [Clostridia bacterium]|nr:thioredoxin [Clostridia bacterium]
MAVIHLTKATFDAEVLKSDKPVFIDFFATWCGPCKMLSPIVEQLAEEVEDVKICKVDVDQEPELAAAFGVSSIPTLVLMKDGKLIDQRLGAVSKKALNDFIHQ